MVEFPRMLHHPDGSRRVVSDDASRDRLLSEGWLLSRYVPVEPAAPDYDAYYAAEAPWVDCGPATEGDDQPDGQPVASISAVTGVVTLKKKRGRPRKS